MVARGALLLAVGVACAAGLATGCRERQVALVPAVAQAGDAPSPPPAVASAAPSGILQGASASARCSFDAAGDDYVQGTLVLDRARAIRLRGWFAGPEHGPAGAFRLVLAGDGEALWALPARTGEPRPDVAEYFHDASMATAGFDQLSDLSAVPSGAYRVILLADDGGGTVACDSGKRLVVR